MDYVLICQSLFVQINHSDELSVWRIKHSQLYVATDVIYCCSAQKPWKRHSFEVIIQNRHYTWNTESTMYVNCVHPDLKYKNDDLEVFQYHIYEHTGSTYIVKNS